MKPRTVKPLQKLAKASASCSKEVSSCCRLGKKTPDIEFDRSGMARLQAAVYGACVNAKYLEVEKDMCKAEFEVFKACVSKAVSICLLCSQLACRFSPLRKLMELLLPCHPRGPMNSLPLDRWERSGDWPPADEQSDYSTLNGRTTSFAENTAACHNRLQQFCHRIASILLPRLIHIAHYYISYGCISMPQRPVLFIHFHYHISINIAAHIYQLVDPIDPAHRPLLDKLHALSGRPPAPLLISFGSI